MRELVNIKRESGSGGAGGTGPALDDQGWQIWSQPAGLVIDLTGDDEPSPPRRPVTAFPVRPVVIDLTGDSPEHPARPAHVSIPAAPAPVSVRAPARAVSAPAPLPATAPAVTAAAAAAAAALRRVSLPALPSASPQPRAAKKAKSKPPATTSKPSNPQPEPVATVETLYKIARAFAFSRSAAREPSAYGRVNGTSLIPRSLFPYSVAVGESTRGAQLHALSFLDSFSLPPTGEEPNLARAFFLVNNLSRGADPFEAADLLRCAVSRIDDVIALTNVDLSVLTLQALTSLAQLTSCSSAVAAASSDMSTQLHLLASALFERSICQDGVSLKFPPRNLVKTTSSSQARKKSSGRGSAKAQRVAVKGDDEIAAFANDNKQLLDAADPLKLVLELHSLEFARRSSPVLSGKLNLVLHLQHSSISSADQKHALAELCSASAQGLLALPSAEVSVLRSTISREEKSPLNRLLLMLL